MILDFPAMKPERFPNFKGGEKALDAAMWNDDAVRILRGTLEPGATIGLHTHTGNSEIIYILSGRGKVLMDGGEEAVRAGQCHYCPQGHTHSLVNDSDVDLCFFAVVPER